MTGFRGLPHRPAGYLVSRAWRDLGLMTAGLALAVAGIGLALPATLARAEDAPPKA
jgi:hypothetical protein